FRRDIEEEFATELQVAETSAGAAAGQQFQFAQTTGLARHAEQREGSVQWAVGRSAAECFVTEDALLGKADNGLEQAVQVAVSEDGFQRAQLLGDGHG